MLQSELKEVKEGDRITFKAQTRFHFRKATRVVVRVDTEAGYIGVKKYAGWSGFWVRLSEVLEHHPKTK